MKKKLVALSLTATMGLSLLAGCSDQNADSTPTPEAGNLATVTNEVTFENTVAWDGQYDVVVVGFGGAGAVAAKNAADAGAKVLIVEKAPEGHEGGNTRYCGQMFVYGNGNYEDTLAYYKALAGSHEVPEALLETYVSKITNMTDVVAEEFGLDKSTFRSAKTLSQTIANFDPEYPELPGVESISLMAAHEEGVSDGYLWGVMRQCVIDRSENIDVWYESPAVHLIQDPGNKTIIGVQVERNGKTLNVRADNGVVMACGGFENNEEMVETYLGLSTFVPQGTLYNTGDGHRMVMEVGADLWHMDVYEGMGALGASTIIEERVAHHIGYMPPCTSGSVLLVSGAGTRFVDENFVTRHGHVENGDVYENPWYPEDIYLIMSNQNYQTALAYQVAIPADYEYTYCGNTWEELAEAAGIDAEGLKASVEKFNGYAESGVDAEYGRSAESMSAFPAEGPYYAVKLAPVILNTQGGARRNENAEVLDTEGNPIPHLYSAGEFGGICALQYQGGGNIAECIIFGSIAGQNAAKEKSYVSSVISEVESEITYTPGVETDIKVADYSDVELGENEYLGIGSGGMGGDIVLKVTVVDGTIQNIEVVDQKETPERFAQVEEKLIPAIIEANSTEVDGVSSCTMSSDAVKAAVENALSQVQ